MKRMVVLGANNGSEGRLGVLRAVRAVDLFKARRERAKSAAKCRGKLIRRWLLTIAVGISALMVPISAFALSESDAAKVVKLLEALEEEFGDFAYDEEVADDWYEQDSESKKLIQAAGFTEKSWKKALDETFCGYLATIPEADILKPFADARRRVKEAKSLPSDQQKMLLQMTDENEKKLLQLRAKGKAFAKAVQPVSKRMQALNGDSPNQE